MKSISCEECKYLTRDVTVEVRVNDLVISSRKFRAYCEKKYVPVLEDGLVLGCSDGEKREGGETSC